MVARYLSDEWFDVVGATADGHSHGTLVLQHTVRGGPDGEVCYHVCLGEADGAVRIVRGPAAHPHATFVEDYATASAVASGALTASAALLAGRIRVGGDLTVLLANQGALAIADPIPAPTRAATTY